MKLESSSARISEPIFVVYNMDHESTSEEDDPPLASDASVVDVARAVGDALTQSGRVHDFLELRDSTRPLAQLAAKHGRAVFFNLVESLGRDSRREVEVPALLRRMKVAYTGNDAATLGMALDKGRARRTLDEQGVPVARGGVVRNGADAVAFAMRRRLKFPLFVKPAQLDASIAVTQASVVRDAETLRAQVDGLMTVCNGRIVVEEYIPGPEINVAACPGGDRWIHAATAIDFSSFGNHLLPIVTYDCKWVEESEEYSARSVPAGELVDARTVTAAVNTARRALDAIGATGCARVDLRVDSAGQPRVIDVNPNPDLHPTAGFSLGFAGQNIEYSAVIGRMVEAAVQRQLHGHPVVPARRPRASASPA